MREPNEAIGMLKDMLTGEWPTLNAYATKSRGEQPVQVATAVCTALVRAAHRLKEEGKRLELKAVEERVVGINIQETVEEFPSE